MDVFRTLRGRIVSASVALAVVFGITFGVLVLSIRDARHAAEVSERSQLVAATANLLERYLLDLETGQRAYVITGVRSFLEPWERARRSYPAAIGTLRQLVVDPVQRRRVEEIGRRMKEYETEWAQLVIDTVPVSQAQAAALVETGQGKRRVDALRRQFDAFLVRQRALSALRDDRADRSGGRAVLLGLGGLGTSVLLVFLFATYLVRSAVVPVEQVAAAARRIRAGDRTVRVPERDGADEAAALTRDFNAMAGTLEETVAGLARQRAELEAVLDSAVEGIAMVDASGSLVLTNQTMERLWRELGLATGGSVSERLGALVARTTAPESYGPAIAAVAADPEGVLEDDFDLVDGRSFRGFTGPVRGPYGFVIGRIFSLRETTAERAAEREKEQFLATVSHELRTPLTSVIGFTELVRDGEAGELTSDQQRFLGIVERSARHLSALVDDLLVVGRTTEGRLDLETEELDLAEVVADCVEAAANVAGEKRIRVELDAAAGLVLEGDRRRLTQLVTNVVGNAVKFTPEGGSVRVGASRSGEAIVLEVADTGVGIPEGELDRLFERFYRASTATRAQVPGTGLGLAISKAIAEAHGGSIAVQSREGEGTTFRIELPGETT